MKTLNLACDHFHFSGTLTLDSPLCRELDFDINKPAETMIFTVKAPHIHAMCLELCFVSYQNEMLTMRILSEQKIVRLLAGLINRLIPELTYLEIDYPSLRIDTRLLSKTFFPGIKIRNIGLDKGQYLIDMESN